MEAVWGIKELCKRFGGATRQPLLHSFRTDRDKRGSDWLCR